MANASNFLENEIADHLFGAATYTAPATLYFALWTAALDDTSTGATAGECSGTNYARVAVTNNATNFPAASGGAKSNGTAITFPTAGAGGWGTATHWAVLDAASSGNILVHGALTVSRTIGEGQTPDFAIGDFDLSVD